MTERHWTPWVFLELIVPLAPLAAAMMAAAAGTRSVDWTADVFWGNELPVMALALCVPSFLGIFEKVNLAKAGGEGEGLWLALLTVGLLVMVPLLMLFVFYLDRYSVLELKVQSVAVKKTFCGAMLVPIAIGAIAKGVLRHGRSKKDGANSA